MIRPDHMKRWNARSAGDSPIAMPWRAAVRPTPQHAAAPTPQQTAMIFTLGASAADGAWTVTEFLRWRRDTTGAMRGAMRPPAWLACSMPTQRAELLQRAARWPESCGPVCTGNPMERPMHHTVRIAAIALATLAGAALGAVAQEGSGPC